jgi:hypothetical protein
VCAEARLSFLLDEHPTELLEEPVDLQRATFLPAAVRSGRHSGTAPLGMTSVKDDFDVGLTFALVLHRLCALSERDARQSRGISWPYQPGREHITGPSSDA